MSDSIALDGFLDKWRSRWPEWVLLERFVAPESRAVAVAWFALVQEFDDILNVAGDPLPANAKLAWWGEELRDWDARRSRHPLGRLLEPVRAPWSRLADALPDLPEARMGKADTAAAFAALARHAEAMAAVEAAMFGDVRGDAAQAIAAQVLAERWQAAGTAALPAAARAGDEVAAMRRWAQVLLQRWPRHAGAAPRRVWAALARARFDAARAAPDLRLAAPLKPLPLVWRGWRAARG